MSAFLFVMSDEGVKALSDEKLLEVIKDIEKELEGLNWDEFQMCTYKWDRASGNEATLIKLKAELENREAGKLDEPLPRVIVPGFNPGK